MKNIILLLTFIHVTNYCSQDLFQTLPREIREIILQYTIGNNFGNEKIDWHKVATAQKNVAKIAQVSHNWHSESQIISHHIAETTPFMSIMISHKKDALTFISLCHAPEKKDYLFVLFEGLCRSRNAPLTKRICSFLKQSKFKFNMNSTLASEFPHLKVQFEAVGIFPIVDVPRGAHVPPLDLYPHRRVSY